MNILLLLFDLDISLKTWSKTSTKFKPKPKRETVSILSRKLKYEKNFYEWVRKRFYRDLLFRISQ